MPPDFPLQAHSRQSSGKASCQSTPAGSRACAWVRLRLALAQTYAATGRAARTGAMPSPFRPPRRRQQGAASHGFWVNPIDVAQQMQRRCRSSDRSHPWRTSRNQRSPAACAATSPSARFRMLRSPSSPAVTSAGWGAGDCVADQRGRASRSRQSRPLPMAAATAPAPIKRPPPILLNARVARGSRTTARARDAMRP